MPRQIRFQRAWFVTANVHSTPRQMIVGQLHAVIEIIGSPSYVQNVHKPGVCARDRLKCGHALEFSEKRTLGFKCTAINDFDGAKRAGHRAGQPNLTASAAADHPQQFVIGNDGNLSGNVVGNGRFYTSDCCEAIPGSARLSRAGEGLGVRELLS